MNTILLHLAEDSGCCVSWDYKFHLGNLLAITFHLDLVLRLMLTITAVYTESMFDYSW